MTGGYDFGIMLSNFHKKKNLEELKKKYEHDHEIAALKNALPGEGDPNAAGVAQSSDKMLSVQKNNENRSLKTNRLFPTPNKPDPMPQNLAFLFTKITPDRAAACDHSVGWFRVHEGDATVTYKKLLCSCPKPLLQEQMIYMSFVIVG